MKIQTRLSPEIISAFRRKIYAYYRRHKRLMPWRDINDPYRVLVSEIMLQQTQVPRVLVKYPDFIRRFPDIQRLARASLRDVLAAWQGLGYNRRALMLKRLAEVVVADSQGIIPRGEETLRRLPGIGPYTAAAIRVFAFDEPAIFIETNIRSVFLNEFFHARTRIHDRQIIPLIEQTLPRQRSREWYYALMDYGAYLKSYMPNPNHRSKHYARQSRFEDSDRQIRGAIIRILIAKRQSSVTAIVQALNKEGKRVRRIIQALHKEQLLQIKGNNIQIRAFR